jgi:hypothetical protein
MAAAVLSAPGTEFGTCAEPCLHTDCAGTRSIAETICRFCDKPIGYDRRFYNDAGYVHASCLEDSIEQERADRTSTK